jgi:hypothetical protein
LAVEEQAGRTGVGNIVLMTRQGGGRYGVRITILRNGDDDMTSHTKLGTHLGTHLGWRKEITRTSTAEY